MSPGEGTRTAKRVNTVLGIVVVMDRDSMSQHSCCQATTLTAGPLGLGGSQTVGSDFSTWERWRREFLRTCGSFGLQGCFDNHMWVCMRIYEHGVCETEPCMSVTVSSRH